MIKFNSYVDMMKRIFDHFDIHEDIPPPISGKDVSKLEAASIRTINRINNYLHQHKIKHFKELLPSGSIQKIKILSAASEYMIDWIQYDKLKSIFRNINAMI